MNTANATALAELVVLRSPNPWADVVSLHQSGHAEAADAVGRAIQFRERTDEMGSFGGAMEESLAEDDPEREDVAA